MLVIVGIFLAQFAQIFFLVLSSKLLRDDRWVGAFFTSWCISLTQFIFVYVVATTNEDMIIPVFFSAASGASIGCVVSHFFYLKYMSKGVPKIWDRS